MGCCRWIAGIAVLLVAVLAELSRRYGGADNLLYEALPYVPAEWFAAVASVGVRLATCELRPVMDAARALSLVPPALQCGDGPGGERTFPVAVSAGKGGSILFARVFVDVGVHCGLCIGYGFRESGAWPPPAETLPSYDSDALLAIALMQGWQEYALAQTGGDASAIRCAVTVRDPLKRLVSMYLYFEAAGEFALRNVSAALKRLPDAAARTAWMFDTAGEETMRVSHAYLMDAMQSGCQRLLFEDFSRDFNSTLRAALRAWNIRGEAHDALVERLAPKHDLSRRSEAQLRNDHHHTGSKFPAAYRREVLRAFQANPRVASLVRAQRQDLGYADDNAEAPPRA